VSSLFPVRMDSLFTRLLLTQLGLVIVLLFVFGTLFYAERNVTVANLYADLWAPQMAEAVGLSDKGSAPLQVLRTDTRPSDARPLPAIAPRFVTMSQRLLSHGMQVQDMLLSQQSGGPPVVWLEILAPDGHLVWLGLPGYVVLPDWPLRLLLGMALVTALTVLASWAFTHRLTRPLEQLRQRMQSHAPGGPVPGREAASGSTPEIMAMDTAYTELLARLEQHQRERSILLAGISHDLRSPLARIRMAAGLLPDETGSTTRRDSIVRNVVVADQLIESFMDYVRSETLTFEQTVDMAEIVRNVVSRFERSPDELQVVAPLVLPWPRANVLMVDRLVSNLVDNAFKHGRLPVKIDLQGNAQHIELTVEDSGDGIDPAEVGRMQEAFSRGNSSRSIAGTGLGLAIVRQIAKRMGGRLDFERHSDRHVVRLSLGTS
jgi:two-component system osmolarity sensor histidine kinase EnvZ